MPFMSTDSGFINCADGPEYDYRPSQAYAVQIGLVWFGSDYPGLIDADAKAKELGLTQDQVNKLMRLHLWQVKTLFTPKNYKFLQRIKIALYFLVGWKPS